MIFPPDKSHCAVDQKCIVSSENGREHRAYNNDRSRVFQYKIDGEIISKNDPRKRCDFLVENESKGALYLIELKGTDVEHAVDQIEETITSFADEFSGFQLYPRIVYRRNTHGVSSSKVLRFKKKYPHHCIRTNKIEEYI